MNLNFDNLSQDSIEYSGFIVSWGRSFGRWSPFLEAYTLDRVSGAQFFWDTGFAFLINRNLSLDFSFGTDLESDLENQFVSLGLSWRMLNL